MMIPILRSSLFPIGAAVLLLFVGCTTIRPYIAPTYVQWSERSAPAPATLRHRVFLIGGSDITTPVLRLLERQVAETGVTGTVLFTGDQIPCCGFPDSIHARRSVVENQLSALLEPLRSFKGRVLFIPGEQEWDDVNALTRLETFIEHNLNRGDVFVPQSGFPGPTEIHLDDHTVLLALNTQWWLTDEEKPFGDTGDYELEEPGDFLLELEDAIRRNRGKSILIAGHHPLFSNGPHGGRFSWDDHFRPLPVLGSMRVLYRKYAGLRQDLAHARYTWLRRELTQIFSNHEDLVYVSGHEASLQYFKKGQQRIYQHYIVSGAGGETERAASGRDAAFTSSENGFITLSYYDDNSVWMEAWSPSEVTTGRLLFRTELIEADPVTPPSQLVAGTNGDSVYPNYKDSTITISANPQYGNAGPFKRTFFGTRYRTTWETPIEVPVLDLGRELGGLTPVKLGGRVQSYTLHLMDREGHSYVLRTIDKEVARSWPEELRNTIAADVTQDQVSLMHPYSAFIVPPLADAAGVYHTNPRLFYVPDDPRLGIYRDRMAGKLVMLEERPDDDMSHLASVGHAKKVIGTPKMMYEVDNDNDHRVDARSYVRARLFDMLISDWDRHADQWRWAAFDAPDGEGINYRPIPRDRDFAFMKMDGVLPRIAQRTKMRKYQDFDHTYGSIKYLNENGLPLDRRFTASLTKQDWIEIAESIRSGITDEVIETAVRSWPDAIFQLNGEIFIEKLKARRDQINEVAAEYYDLLSKDVDVVGSHKHERFEVTRLEDGQVEVTVFKTNRDGEVRKEFFRRRFDPEETREVRLYGLGGDDQFVIQGNGSDKIRVRAVGGQGRDVLSDSSRSGGTIFYDSESGSTSVARSKARLVLSENPTVNRYDLYSYRYDRTSPLLYFGSNKDDGAFIGGGVSLIKNGFRKNPWAARHQIMANVAAKTGAFNIYYNSRFTSVLGHWDAGVEAFVRSPNNIRNFYGLGNETPNTDEEAHFYQARLSQAGVKPALLRRLEEGALLHFAPSLTVTAVREDEDRIVAIPQEGINPETFRNQWYGAFETGLTLGIVDEISNPLQGYRLEMLAIVNQGLRSASSSFTTLSSNFTMYLSPSLYPQVTLAFRVGGARNFGDFPFYAANTLGGTENLRGYRSTRFAGRTSFYSNAEIRAKLFDFSGYFGYGQFGALGFLDNGRVWTDGENSRRWHQGYGGGLWMSLYEEVVLQASYGLSREDRTLNVGIGFLY